MPVRRPRLSGPGAAVVALVVVLTGCSGDEESAPQPTATASAPANSSSGPEESSGPDDQAGRPGEPYAGRPPAEVLTLMRDTVTRAQSVRVTGTMPMDGQPVELDVRLSRAGRVLGKVTTEAEGSWTTAIAGDRGWLRPGQKMVTALAAGDRTTARYLTGKWLAFGRDTAVLGSQFDDLAMDTFFANLITEEDLRADLVRVDTGRRFAGRAAVGFRRAGEPGTVFVAADGSGEPLAFLDPDGGLRFSEWNRQFKVAPPPAAEVIAEKDWT